LGKPRTLIAVMKTTISPMAAFAFPRSAARDGRRNRKSLKAYIPLMNQGEFLATDL
jgi:hypothetical protein